VLADNILRERGYCFDKKDKAEIMRVMVRIAQYTCPEGEEIDTIAKWVNYRVLKGAASHVIANTCITVM